MSSSDFLAVLSGVQSSLSVDGIVSSRNLIEILVNISPTHPPKAYRLFFPLLEAISQAEPKSVSY